MPTFGQNLRIYRRQSRDPQRGGLLTQERLGELIGAELGDTGYSGAAVSDWERDRSKIAEDDRLVLVGLVTILHNCGGLDSPDEANELLRAGNYRSLNALERSKAFPEWQNENEQPTGEAVKLERQIHQVGPGYEQPTKQLLTQTRRKQLLLLEKVHSFWVEGVLQTSVDDAALLTLAQEHRDDLVAHPWVEVMGQAVYQSRETSESDNMFESYMMANRALLILGEPGAGKTISLITLASELITQARIDPIAPIPVILNLGSWAELRRPMSKWIVEELTNKYQIPRKVGREWLERDELVVMLDGFDEVPERFGVACARAINQFREMRGLTGIVICSRNREYEQVKIPLLLGGAVVIQPLGKTQINTYLAAAGSRLIALRSAINNDPGLKEMASSPLMLCVMDSAYSYTREDLTGVVDEKHHEQQSSPGYWQRRLFDAYVKRMFHSRGNSHSYTKPQTELWLGWLARQMFQFNNPQLLIEQIQPSWLPNRKWRWYYMMLVGFLSGLTGGILMWLFLQIMRLYDPGLPGPFFNWISSLKGDGQLVTEAFTIVIGNIILGLIVALLQGNYFEQLRRQDKESESKGWRYQRHLISVGVVVGVLTAATVVLVGTTNSARLGPEGSSQVGPKSVALIWGVTEVVVFVTVARYVYGRSYRHDIRPVEALSWSWSSALRGLIIGLLLAALSEIIGKYITGAPYNPETSIILGPAGFILGGLRGRKVEKKNRPNQGIYLSLVNSFKAALISAVLVGTLASLRNTFTYALLTGLITFIIGGGLLGGANVVKHFLVRSFLWYNGDIPWRLADFLDYTASLAYLRKVGGSYIFIHRLLQRHFASLYAPATRPERLKIVDTAGVKRNLEKTRFP